MKSFYNFLDAWWSNAVIHVITLRDKSVTSFKPSKYLTAILPTFDLDFLDLDTNEFFTLSDVSLEQTESRYK